MKNLASMHLAHRRAKVWGQRYGLLQREPTTMLSDYLVQRFPLDELHNEIELNGDIPKHCVLWSSRAGTLTPCLRRVSRLIASCAIRARSCSSLSRLSSLGHH